MTKATIELFREQGGNIVVGEIEEVGGKRYLKDVYNVAPTGIGPANPFTKNGRNFMDPIPIDDHGLLELHGTDLQWKDNVIKQYLKETTGLEIALNG